MDRLRAIRQALRMDAIEGMGDCTFATAHGAFSRIDHAAAEFVEKEGGRLDWDRARGDGPLPGHHAVVQLAGRRCPSRAFAAGPSRRAIPHHLFQMETQELAQLRRAVAHRLARGGSRWRGLPLSTWSSTLRFS